LVSAAAVTRNARLDPVQADCLREGNKRVIVMAMTPLQERARGRWHGILPAIGISEKFLKRKNGPCPVCGGKDRFRFTDIDGKGTFYCNNCKGGNGVALVMKFTNLPFIEAAQRIERVIGGAPANPPAPERSEQQRRAALNALWQAGRTIQTDDPADRWLHARGVGMQNYPQCLRTGMRVRHSGSPVTWHPAMLAMVTDASGKPAQIHRTYLTADGVKAPVEKVRMFCAGTVPAGGAVRLTPPEPILGIAEGIETAFAAMKLFGVSTWAALNAGGVERFEPPADIKRLVIFADNDQNGAGQRASYALASRLSGRFEIDVRIPETPGTDFNDVLIERDQG
jgi:putative DNA primase/helicase